MSMAIPPKKPRKTNAKKAPRRAKSSSRAKAPPLRRQRAEVRNNNSVAVFTAIFKNFDNDDALVLASELPGNVTPAERDKALEIVSVYHHMLDSTRSRLLALWRPAQR